MVFNTMIGVAMMCECWAWGLDEDVDPSRLMDQIDQVLKSGNDDYAAVRKYTLSDPEIRCFKSDVFYRFMESIGKTGAQNKVPRVMNAHQSEMWLDYLRKEGLL